MSKTLLIDLDNTLLRNEMDAFVPAYLQGLASRLAPYVDPKIMTKTLLAATHQMSQNLQPDLSLMEVFDAAFFPALNTKKADLQPVIDDFYEENFPHLRDLTSPQPEAVGFITQALEQGYRIGIATNPLFPLTAIEQRLDWAGFPPDQYHFDLIPSYSSFHFAKPNPAYFAEFLAQMGWPEGPVVMIGDEADFDIAGARQLGIAAFWTPSQPAAAWTGSEPEPPRGGLAEVLPWLESAPPERLKPDFTSPESILGILRSTPAALQTLCSTWCRPSDRVLWTRRPEPEEWSLAEVLCHLRDVEAEVFLPRFTKLVSEDNPFIQGIDSDPWAQERQYIHQDGQQALAAYITSRKELLAMISGLSPTDWQRPARHAIFGPTHLRELASFVADHDRLHIQQIARLIHSK
jgi:HAD superfamily hydrolase (TIGR01549 family)